jgi:hypothetical protein
MKRIIIISVLLLTTGCAQYLLRTGFYNLSEGMSKQEYLNTFQAHFNQMGCTGCQPSSSRTLRVNGDMWEILVYELYDASSLQTGYPRVDHHEFVAFKNGKLAEWGNGNMPISIQQNPNIINHNLNENQ